MSGWGLVVGIGLGLVLAAALGVLYLRWLTRPPRPKKPDLHKVDEEGFAPLPIDPDNPPTWRYYRPKSANSAARRTCHCHNRPIGMDQKVLWWPLPDGSVRLLCEDADMKAAQ